MDFVGRIGNKQEGTSKQVNKKHKTTSKDLKQTRRTTVTSSKIPTLKLNSRRMWIRRIMEASVTMLKKKIANQRKKIKIDLAALAELNNEYAILSDEDRQALDELNIEGADKKRELAVLQQKPKKQQATFARWSGFRSPLSASSAAYEVLFESGEPLHYQEITKRVIESGRWVSRGYTPWRTVNSAIVKDSRFVRVRRGVYGLREWPKDAA